MPFRKWLTWRPTQEVRTFHHNLKNGFRKICMLKSDKIGRINIVKKKTDMWSSTGMFETKRSSDGVAFGFSIFSINYTCVTPLISTLTQYLLTLWLYQYRGSFFPLQLHCNAHHFRCVITVGIAQARVPVGRSVLCWGVAGRVAVSKVEKTIPSLI